MDNGSTILIVDDDPNLTKTLSDIVRLQGFVPIVVAKGKTALDRLNGEMPAVALIDLKLPDMDGLEVMRKIKERSPGTECIVLTGYGSQESAIEAVNLGAYGYMQKPYDVEHLVLTIRRAVEKRETDEGLRKSEASLAEAQRIAHLGNWDWDIEENELLWSDEIYRIFGLAPQEFGATYEAFLNSVHPEDREFVKKSVDEALYEEKPYSIDHRVVLPDGSERIVHEQAEVFFDETSRAIRMIGTVQDITERKRAEEELQHTLEKLRKALGGIIQALALTVETRDPYTAGHQRRATNLARAIATEMGLSEEQIDGIRMAGVVHDLGKIAVPAGILNKPGRLTENEFGIIQTHPQVAYDILKTIEFPWPVAQIVHEHHERIDGSGYPAGLKGDEIMLEARILAVADVIEAMSSHRPYRPAHSIDEALGEIRQNRGMRYDPEVVDACLSLFSDEGFELEHA